MLGFGRIGLPLTVSRARRIAGTSPNPDTGTGGTGGGDTGSGSEALFSRALRLTLFDDLITSAGSIARSAILEA